MAVTTTILRVLPGKTSEFIDFICDVRAGRVEEHGVSRDRVGLEVERVWLEPTASGDVIIMYYEGKDPAKSMRMLEKSTEDYDLWYRDRLHDITGVDFCKADAVELGELVFESPRLDRKGPDVPYATVIPIQPGLKDEWRQWLDELLVSREDEYRSYQERYGLSIEKLFVVRTSEGPAGVLYAEGEDPAGGIARFARSHQPFDAWMREEMLYLNGIDFVRRQTAPAPELILDWKAKTRKAAA